jgi:ribosomal protein S18 acetylase RimI-like enzyme
MLLLGGVQDSNDRAKAFYRKLGFQEVGGYHGADNSYNVDMVVKTR